MTTVCLFVHPLVDICAVSVFLVIMESVAMNIHVQIFCLRTCFTSLGFVPGSGMEGSYAESVFDFLRNFQAVESGRASRGGRVRSKLGLREEQASPEVVWVDRAAQGWWQQHPALEVCP